MIKLVKVIYTAKNIVVSFFFVPLYNTLYLQIVKFDRCHPQRFAVCDWPEKSSNPKAAFLDQSVWVTL